jgi:hypothetical protein
VCPELSLKYFVKSGDEVILGSIEMLGIRKFETDECEII